jgi:hypothetical protein
MLCKNDKFGVYHAKTSLSFFGSASFMDITQKVVVAG